MGDHKTAAQAFVQQALFTADNSFYADVIEFRHLRIKERRHIKSPPGTPKGLRYFHM
jgi:hypothetical protein